MMQTILSEGKLAAKALAAAPACLFLQAIEKLSDNNNAMAKAIRKATFVFCTQSSYSLSGAAWQGDNWNVFLGGVND
jgi:hypothetical protein